MAQSGTRARCKGNGALKLLQSIRINGKPDVHQERIYGRLRM